MSRICWHNNHLSKYEQNEVIALVDVLEDYLCEYKLNFDCVFQVQKGCKKLIRLDIKHMGSSAVIATYSFQFKTLSKFYRKKYLGSIKYDDIVEELESR